MRYTLRSLVAGIFFSGASALFAQSALAADAGITQDGSGLTIGSGWYTQEIFDGRPFRWVNNDAAIVIHKPQSSVKKISIALQGGPGLANAQDFVLHVRNSANQDIAVVHVLGTQTKRFDIPVQAGRDNTVKLHVDGGGNKIPKDPRVLNFRVFSIADASSDPALAAGHPDIVRSPIHLEKNWFALEEFKGETFRWVQNDATFSVDSSKAESRQLSIATAAGPAVKKPYRWTLVLEDASGKSLQTVTINSRGEPVVTLPLHQGSNTFKLHVESNGKKAANDPRILSFRVFNMSLL